MKYSNYFDTNRKIKHLKKLSARNANSDSLVPLLQNLFYDKMEINSFNIGDQFIYRARKNEPHRLFTDISELKHPESSPRKGRMNDIGESFFYGGICELGTIYELVPDIGRAVSRSKCNKVKLICPVSLKVKSAFRKEYFSRAFPV